MIYIFMYKDPRSGEVDYEAFNTDSALYAFEVSTCESEDILAVITYNIETETCEVINLIDKDLPVDIDIYFCSTKTFKGDIYVDVDNLEDIDRLIYHISKEIVDEPSARHLLSRRVRYPKDGSYLNISGDIGNLIYIKADKQAYETLESYKK